MDSETPIIEIPLGQRYGTMWDDKSVVWIIHQSEECYEVLTTWRVRETIDDDFGTWACGCPLQFRGHEHRSKTYPTLDEAWKAYEAEMALRVMRKH